MLARPLYVWGVVLYRGYFHLCYYILSLLTLVFRPHSPKDPARHRLLNLYRSGRVVPVLKYAPRHAAYGSVAVGCNSIPHFAVDGGKWSALHSGCFIPRERKGFLYSLNRRLGAPRIGLGPFGEGKIRLLGVEP